ncbi:MAG: hypothetical protein EPN61_14875 [Burkholderiaceae bacterium]|nr:MAG: hypothetical protein EPN61_14875 [Burkholderiaceae bacterium]
MTIKTIHIFRKGQHTEMGGLVLNFGEQDIERMASAYSESARSAPLVLGHPTESEPSYGTVKSLFARAGDLHATVDMSDALVNLIRAGRFKKVSASFISPGRTENPRPDAWYLKHLGFLGAMIPAVKGLNTLSFAERAGGYFTGDATEIDRVAFDFAERAQHATPEIDSASYHLANLERLMSAGMSYVSAVSLVDHQARSPKRQKK